MIDHHLRGRDLQGLRIGIAGSSQGTGFAIAQFLQGNGAEVWLTGRNAETLQTASKELFDAPFSQVDLTESLGRSQWLEKIGGQWGRLDGLVLNLGSGFSSHRGLDAPDSEWKRIFELNFFSHVHLVRESLSLLRRSPCPSIVSISSIAGQFRLPAPFSYASAKAALNHFCLTAAAELARYGIRYNLLSPGNILTPGGSWEKRLHASHEAQREIESYVQANVPLQRFADPREIATGVAFLLSEKSKFMTGSCLRMDGGQTPFL